VAETEVLRVRLSPEGVSELVAALRTVGNESVKQGARATQSFAGIGASVGRLRNAVGALGLALSVGALVSFARGAANLADELDEATEKMGGTVTKTAGLALAFKLSGFDITGSGRALGEFSKRLADFERGGGKAASSLRALGLSAADFKGKDLSESVALVAQRLAPLEAGFRKNAIAIGAFGNTALRLIPGLNLIGREGMDGFIRRVNLMFSPEAVASAGNFADVLQRVGFEVQGLGVQFVAGFAQPMVRAIETLEGEIDSDLTDSIRKFGFEAGKVAAVLTLTFANLGDSFLTFIEVWKVRLQEAAALARSVVSRGALDAGAQMLVFEQQFKALREGVEGRNAARRAEAERISSSTYQPLATPRGGRPAPDVGDRLAVARAADEAERAAVRAFFKSYNEAAEAAYARGRTSLREYFDERLRITDEELAAERRLVARQIASVSDEDDTKAEAERAKLRGELKVKEIEFESRRRAIAEQREDAERRLAVEVASLEAQADKSRAAQHQRRLAEIDELSRKFAIAVAQQGDKGAEALARVDQFRGRLLAGEDFAQRLKDAQDAQADLEADRAAIEARVRSGQIDQAEGERQLLQLELQRAGALREVAAAALAAARAAADPEAIRQAEELVRRAAELGTALGEAARASASFGTDAVRAGIDEVARGLDLTNEATLRTAGYFRELTRSILADLSRIAARLLALQFATALGFIPGAPRAAAGGLVGPPLPGRAAGGIIRGPGGPTADLIPVRVSAGEYIVQASAVAAPGVLEHLEAINAGAAVPGLRGPRWPRRFSDGGLVAGSGIAAAGAPASATIDGQVTIGLEDGLVARALASPAGRRALLAVVQAEKAGFRQALS